MKKIQAAILPVWAMTETEQKEFADWVWKMRSLNMFQPDVMSYPRTVMTAAGNDDGALLYIPLQAVLMYDAIAPKPDITPRQEALCLWRIGEAVDRIAQDGGFGEVYFFCKDDRVSDICSEHGFTEITNVRVLRRKVPPKDEPVNDGTK